MYTYDKQCEEDVVEYQEDDSLHFRLDCEDAEVNHIGVIWPGHNAGDHQDGNPFEQGHAASADASIRRHLDTAHHWGHRGRGLQTNNGRGSLECVDWLLISLCHDKLLLETMNECDHYYQIKISWSWPLHCTVSVSHSLSPRIVLFLTITFVSIFRVFIFFTHSTLIERPMI